MESGQERGAAHLRALEKRCRENAAELKRLQKRRRRSSLISPARWQTACLLQWMAGDRSEAALDFLEPSEAEAGGTRARLAERLRVATENTPPEERRRLLSEPATPGERARLRRARARLEEVGLYSWLTEVNTGKGIAPVSSLLLGEMDRLRAEPARPGPVLPQKKSRFQWLRRWRRRWGVRLARLQAGERPTPEACWKKVAGATLGDSPRGERERRAGRGGRGEAPAAAGEPAEPAGAREGYAGPPGGPETGPALSGHARGASKKRPPLRTLSSPGPSTGDRGVDLVELPPRPDGRRKKTPPGELRRNFRPLLPALERRSPVPAGAAPPAVATVAEATGDARRGAHDAHPGLLRLRRR